MAKKVIYMWIDFTSPMSYIAYNNLIKAINQTKREDLIVNLKTYQLDPDLDVYDAEQLKDSKKEIRSEKRLLDKPRIVNLVKDAGIKFNFKRLKPVNTVHPHRLLQLAKTYDEEHKVANSLVSALFKSYWTENKDISQQDELVKIAMTSGIDEKSAIAVFDTDKYLEMLFLDEQEGIDAGINGAPFISFPDESKISGSMTVKQAVDFINKIPVEQNEQNPAGD